MIVSMFWSRSARRRMSKRRGQVYDGPAAWCDDPQVVIRPGFYALSENGKMVLGDVPLVCVDDAPLDPEDGSCHYEFAGPHDYPQRAGEHPVLPGDIIDMEIHAEGRAEVSS